MLALNWAKLGLHLTSSMSELLDLTPKQELQINLQCVRTYSWAERVKGMTRTARNMTLFIFYMFNQMPLH